MPSSLTELPYNRGLMPLTLDPELRRAVRDADVLALARDLVRTPSHPGVDQQEQRVAHRLADYLRGAGIEVSLSEVRPGRPNLLARLPTAPNRHAPRPQGTGRSLLFCGHTDTVAPNALMTIDPFGAEVRDGRLYGRGACDMKGGLAAMAAALVALSHIRSPLAGEVSLAAVIDEEMESLGAEALIRSGVKADGCVVGEPTANQVAIAHRGLEWLEVEFTGRATHAGARAEGVNAIAAAAHFIRLLEEELRPALVLRSHPLVGAPSVNVGAIRGGDHPSTVAARCSVQVDRRWVPGETVEQFFTEIEDMLARVRAGSPGLSTALRRLPGSMATMVHGPLETAPDHPLAAGALECRRRVSGADDTPGAFPAWTDAALLWREAGIPCLVMGPGHLAQAHSADEWIAVDQLDEAALQYALLALSFCGPS